MLTDEKKAGVVEKWKCFRECSSRKQKKLLDHSFAFCVEYDCGTENAFRFEPGGEEAAVIGLEYVRPRKDDFVIFARRNEHIYIELPYMEDGFFLRYNYFIEKILEG